MRGAAGREKRVGIALQALVCVLSVPLLWACRRDVGPEPVVVAEIDGRDITPQDFDAYLDRNLGDRSKDEGQVAAPEDDRVRSRLFDQFVEEQILLAEALRRGIEVSDADLDAYLAEPPEEGSEEPRVVASRELARRELMVERLREGYVRSQAVVTPGEVDAYIAEHGASLAGGRRLILRSLELDSPTQAEKVRQQIRRRRITFDEAIVSWGTPGEGEPTEVVLESLPEPMQAAVRGLRPGEVTRPVVLMDRVFLCQVQAWTLEGKDRERALRERAYEELLQARYEDASRQLVRRLRARLKVTLHPGRLPFPYVPDEPSPAAGDGASR